MNKTFNLLFYIKKAKINAQGEAPIYMRITIDGKISEISTKRTVQPNYLFFPYQFVIRIINFLLK